MTTTDLDKARQQAADADIITNAKALVAGAKEHGYPWGTAHMPDTITALIAALERAETKVAAAEKVYEAADTYFLTYDDGSRISSREGDAWDALCDATLEYGAYLRAQHAAPAPDGGSL